MIDVPELDLYLKTAFYVFNSNSEVYRDLDFSEDIKSWIKFLQTNQLMLHRFEHTAERPGFGFAFEPARATSMYGVREVVGLFDPHLVLPAQFLKIYPRLIYLNGFLQEPSHFEKFKYFFRYYPKMVVPIFRQREGTGEVYQEPSHYWVKGTHGVVGDEHHISYNVAVEVDLNTIIEEELHAQTEGVHGTTTVVDIVRDIEEKMPELKIEIEQNLNRILSTEEKIFQDLGEALSIEGASELRILDQFVKKFEAEVIENTEI